MEQRRDINRRYKETHPEVVQKFYADKHPEVHRVAVQRCMIKSPEVHKAAVKPHRDKNHRGA